MKNLISILVVLFSVQSFAHTIYEKKSIRNTEYLVHYQDSEKWVVDHYVEKEGELQDLVMQRVFYSEKNAQDLVDSMIVGFQKKIPDLNPEPIIDENKTVNVVWNATNEWNAQWEARFTEWFRNVFYKGYFVEYNVETDCADAAYAARWIFARENSLPAAAQLAGSNRLVTNETMRSSWYNLPRHENWWQDRVFMAAINYVMNNTYTHTLVNDAFPIQIDETYFAPGTIYLTLGTQSGHTRIINRVGPSTLITQLASTVPRAVRPLSEYSFMPHSHSQNPEKGGLLRFRWLERSGTSWRLRRKTQMPGYSLEQYGDEFNGNEDFFRVVKRRIFGDVIDQDYLDAQQFIESIKTQMQERLSVVQEGSAVCSQQPCNPGSENYENWSTPSRDGRLLERINQLYALITFSEDSRVRELYEAEATEFSLQITSELSVRLGHLVSLVRYNMISSDPRDDLLIRWGLVSYSDIEIETEHPYTDSMDQVWLMTVPEGHSVIFHFEDFSTEHSFDYVTITGADGEEYEYTGEDLGDFSSDPIPGGGVISFRFQTDDSVTDRGFKVREIELVSND